VKATEVAFQGAFPKNILQFMNLCCVSPVSPEEF